MTRVSLVVVTMIFGGISLTLSQSSWVPQDAGLPQGIDTRQISVLPVDAQTCWGLRVHQGTPAYFIRTTDGGNTWISGIPGAADLVGTSIDAVDEMTAWVVLAHEVNPTGAVFKTTDGGATWVQQTSAFPEGGPRFIHFFDAMNGLAVGNPHLGYWAIYTTSNGGAFWSRVSSDSIPAPVANEIAYLGGHPAAYGSSFWFPTNAQGLYRTTNRGRSWQVTRSAFPSATGMGVAFKDSLNGLLTGDGPFEGIRRTTDGGLTFSAVSAPSGLTPSFITAVPGTRGTYVASTFDLFPFDPGSAYTLNDGDSWTMIDNLSHGRSRFVSATVGWSGGANDSLFKWVDPMLLPVEEEGPAVPEAFDLYQNYPNPFNPATTIGFSVLGRSHVLLTVYDLLGREVANALDEVVEKGEKHVTFDASGLASGVYLYRLQVRPLEANVKGQVRGTIITRKMMLMR